jgi:cytochrome c
VQRASRAKLRNFSLLAFAAAAFAAACVTPADDAAERGRVFAEARCGSCHATGLEGTSPYAPAPPFRTLHERYPVENLAEALAEGISVPHGGERPMPEITLTPEQIDDLIAYLQTLE